jgi:hypothetical protein
VFSASWAESNLRVDGGQVMVLGSEEGLCLGLDCQQCV